MANRMPVVPGTLTNQLTNQPTCQKSLAAAPKPSCGRRGVRPLGRFYVQSWSSMGPWLSCGYGPAATSCRIAGLLWPGGRRTGDGPRDRVGVGVGGGGWGEVGAHTLHHTFEPQPAS